MKKGWYSMSESRLMSVKGTAKVTGAPDWVVIILNIESESYNYEECTRILAERTEQLKRELLSVGIEQKSLKTFHFDINTSFDWVDGKRIFRGYKASHKLKVEFPFDKNYMNKVMQRLGQTKSHASFRIAFTIAEPEYLREQALAEAVKNATRKAELLAEAAGVRLGDIVRIDYTWTDILIESPLAVREVAAPLAAPNYDFTPEDIDVKESVSVVWTIE
jgi:uncharacterized protein YggE